MYKECFDILSQLRSDLNQIEGELKYVGHDVSAATGVHVNRALVQLRVFRDSLLAVDRALEAERG